MLNFNMYMYNVKLVLDGKWVKFLEDAISSGSFKSLSHSCFSHMLTEVMVQHSGVTACYATARM